MLEPTIDQEGHVDPGLVIGALNQALRPALMIVDGRGAGGLDLFEYN
jgi:hypothetical protein